MASQAPPYSFRAAPETCMLLTSTSGSRVPLSGGSRQRSSGVFGRMGFPVLSNSSWVLSKLESIGRTGGGGGIGRGAGGEAPPPPPQTKAGATSRNNAATPKKPKRRAEQTA